MLLDNCTNTTGSRNISDCFTYGYIFTDCDAGYFGPNSFYSSFLYQVIVYGIYCPLLGFAFLGNLAVCITIFSIPKMHTVTFFFIVNLAIADMLTAIFCIPFTFVPSFILYYWPFGSIPCKIISYFQAVSIFVSVFTLIAISSDRYMAISWPLRPRMTKRSAATVIFVVWLLALVIALPIAIVSGLNQPSAWHRQCDRYVCTEKWPEKHQNKEYSMALLILQFVIPLIVMIFTYTNIAVKVWCKRIPGEAHSSRDLLAARSKRKTIKMLLAVVTVFITCWLPYNVILVMIYSNLVNNIDESVYLWLILHWLAMSHSCYNFIIYCYMNHTFHIGFLQMLSSIPCCKNFISLETDSTNVALEIAGLDSQNITVPHTSDTCSAYRTVRPEMSTYQHPVRSTSMGMYSNKISQRTRPNFEYICEDQV